MINEEKTREIELKILEVATTFIENPDSIEEIAKKTGISSSSVQRYLNDKRIINLLDIDTYNYIQKLLKENRIQGCKKAGYISSKNNIAIKDECGKFAGSHKK